MKYHKTQYQCSKLSLFLGLLLLSLFFLQVHTVSAQTLEWTEDPLKKPEIWKKLVVAPTDTQLWEKYWGAKYTSLSVKDQEKINLWKQELMLRKLASNEAVVGLTIKNIDEGFFIDEAAFAEIDRKIEEIKKSSANASEVRLIITVSDLAGIEAIILPERDDLGKLKSNVIENFAIIEDVYNDVYEEYGIKYVYYKDKYPKGEVSKAKWIEDNDAQLLKIKNQYLAKLKEKFLVVPNSDSESTDK